MAYGARAVTKGGFQSIPQVAFPGGALLGCSAGLVNLPRIKGNHNAMHSGIEAAEVAHDAIKAGRAGDTLDAYDTALRTGPVGKDLKIVRNVAPLNGIGPLGGLAIGGFDMWFQTIFVSRCWARSSMARPMRRRPKRPTSTSRSTIPTRWQADVFDRLTNVSFSMTNHEESQPCHLHLKDDKVPVEVNLAKYAGPSARYCPAGVYEFVEKDGKPEFVINFQNCVHCKTCDIKDPSQNINWVTPQGGDGPNYPNM